MGPKSLATAEVQRKRLERPCPRRQSRPVNYLVADVIREYLTAAKVSKRSYRNDKRYGKTWTERLSGRSLEEVTPADLEKIRAERLAGRPRRDDDAKDKKPCPVTPAPVNREYAFLNEAEIKDFRLHDTRHTFASRLAMEQVDLLAIKELGGWKTLSMVQRYAHLSPGHQRQAIERLVTRAVAVPRTAEAASQE